MAAAAEPAHIAVAAVAADIGLGALVVAAVQAESEREYHAGPLDHC